MSSADDTRKTVRVACRLVNGIELRLHKPGYDDGTGSGYRPAILDRRVALKGPHSRAAGVGQASMGEPLINEGVDADFMAAWLSQNAKSMLVGERLIYVVDGEPEAQP